MNKTVKNKMVLLTGGGPLPMILAHGLYECYGSFPILIEDKEPAKTMIKRRLKMLGYVETFGQLAFGILQKFIHKFSQSRKQELISTNNLKTEPPNNCEIIPVGSVNSDTCRSALQQLDPQLVVVIGTRMIGEETLDCVEAKFINYHAGINPSYRGMNGGYWALANNDAENFGITVHLVDKGVDTGSIIAVSQLSVPEGHNITTYPYIQVAAARDVLIQAVDIMLSGSFVSKKMDGRSQQWFHPTIWRYLWTGVRRQIW